jgi:hypothetical protein
VTHAVADAAVDLVERAPRPGRPAEGRGGLHCAAEGAGPDDHLVAIAVAVVQETGERSPVAVPLGGQVGIPPRIPAALYTLSPCRVSQIGRMVRCRFIRKNTRRAAR